MKHTKDADCQEHLDEDGNCQVCGAYHGAPCPWCGGRGFHTDDQCPNIFEWGTPEYNQARDNWLMVESALWAAAVEEHRQCQ